MARLTTTFFKVHVANQLLESISETAPSTYYAYVSQSRPWEGEDTPDPEESGTAASDTYEGMVFGKRVTVSDACIMAPRYDWISGQVYSMYDDDDPDLYTKEFFVCVAANTEYHVFKCLNNVGGIPSTAKPLREDTTESDTFYQTSDGYQWKYLYSISSSVFRTFATNDWIPIQSNANTSGNASPGVIDVITVVAPGTNYNSYSNGYFQNISADANGNFSYCTIESSSSANANFYKNSAIKVVAGPGAGQQRVITEYTVAGGQKVVYLDDPWEPTDPPDTSSQYEITPNVVVTGDGSGVQARALINASSNSIYAVEVTARGNNYTYATTVVNGNTGQVNATSNTLISANSAELRVIIGPPYGHGGNLAEELGATALGFSVEFANNENGLIPDNGSYRQIGLLRDPLFANVTLTLSSISGTFTVGEEIEVVGTSLGGEVTNYNANTSTLTLTNVSGGVAVSANIIGATSNASATVSTLVINGVSKDFTTFDQRTRFGVTFNGTPVFDEGDLVTQTVTEANGYVHFANTTFVALVDKQGIFTTNDVGNPNPLTTNSCSANVNSILSGDIKKGSGQLLYIENIEPITRDSSLSETLRFIIEF